MLDKIRFAANQFINFELQQFAFAVNSPLAKPTQIILSLTERCCFRCKMCKCWKLDAHKKDELSTEEWKRIILEFRNWLRGTFYIHFTGGEPLLREDFVELVRFASSLKIKTFLNTNGFLIDEAMARTLVEAHLDYAVISLDGITPGIFDDIRGVKEANQRVLAGIQHLIRLKQEGMILGISAAVMEPNLKELVPIVKWAEEQNIDRVGFHALRHDFRREQRLDTESSRGDPRKSALWVKNFSLLDRVVDDLIALKQKGSPVNNSIRHLAAMKEHYRGTSPDQKNFRCMVGHNNFVVESNGDIRLCHLMEPIGNIRETTVRESWHSRAASERRRQIKKCRKQCMTKALYTRTLREKAELFFFLFKKKNLK